MTATKQSGRLPERHKAHLNRPPIANNYNNNNKQCSAVMTYPNVTSLYFAPPLR